jgi:FMN-dependent NADH-azoreductase
MTSYLRAILKTIGLRDIHILTLEGVTRGPAMRELTITDARQSVDRIEPPR